MLLPSSVVMHLILVYNRVITLGKGFKQKYVIPHYQLLKNTYCRYVMTKTCYEVKKMWMKRASHYGGIRVMYVEVNFLTCVLE